MKYLLPALFIILSAVTAPAEPVTVKVGATLPLSGRVANVGNDIRRGFELALADYSTANLKFALILEDNQHEAKLGAATAQKLLQIDKVDVLVSLWDIADVVAPLAERARTPHISIRWDPGVAQKYSYSLTFESTYFSYVDSLVALIKALKLKSLGILTEEGQGWVLGSDYLKQKAAAEGIPVVGDERFPNSETDHAGLVLRLLQKKPDYIVLMNNPPHTEILARRLRELNPKLPFTGYLEYTSEPLLMDRQPFVSQLNAAPWFQEKFINKYGEPFKARAPHAYDIIMLLARMHDGKPTKLSAAQIMEEFSKIKDVPGAAGTLNVNKTRNIEAPCVWKVFEDGKLKPFS